MHPRTRDRPVGQALVLAQAPCVVSGHVVSEMVLQALHVRPIISAHAPVFPQEPVVFVNGDKLITEGFAPLTAEEDAEVNGDNAPAALGPTADAEMMEAALQQACAEQLPTIQRALYYGELQPTDDVLAYLYDVKPDVVKRTSHTVRLPMGVVCVGVGLCEGVRVCACACECVCM